MLLEEELSQQARENQADEKSEVGSRDATMDVLLQADGHLLLLCLVGATSD